MIIEVDHPPSKQHHGGGLAFGPDGLLYIATGDGGGPGDPNGNAQDLRSLLGKVLRIAPTPDADHGYEVPETNPFVDTPEARPEIFSYGLRNPYRIGFDPTSGDLWIADVGQRCWEELNWRSAGTAGGENFEWDEREGSHRSRAGVRPMAWSRFCRWATPTDGVRSSAGSPTTETT